MGGGAAGGGLNWAVTGNPGQSPAPLLKAHRAFVPRLELVAIGGERPLPSLEGQMAELTQTSSASALAFTGQLKPSDRSAGAAENLIKPVPPPG